MKITISGHHVDITEGIKSAIEKRLNKIATHYPSLLSMTATVTVEQHQQRIELKTHFENIDVVVHSSDKNLYAAIASVAKKMESALSHRKGIVSANKKEKYEVEQTDMSEL